MTTQPQSLTAACFTLQEFARYLGKHVLTVRKWFDADPDVIRIKRGQQKDQILIPIARAQAVCKEMGVPDSFVRTFIDDHKRRLQKTAVASQIGPRPATKKPSRPAGKQHATNGRR